MTPTSRTRTAVIRCYITRSYTRPKNGSKIGCCRQKAPACTYSSSSLWCIWYLVCPRSRPVYIFPPLVRVCPLVYECHRIQHLVPVRLFSRDVTRRLPVGTRQFLGGLLAGIWVRTRIPGHPIFPGYPIFYHRNPGDEKL